MSRLATRRRRIARTSFGGCRSRSTRHPVSTSDSSASRHLLEPASTMPAPLTCPARFKCSSTEWIPDTFRHSASRTLRDDRSVQETIDRSVIVNARLARMFWGDERAAIGQAVTFLDERPSAPGAGAAGRRETEIGFRTGTVVGVVPTLQSLDVGVPDAPDALSSYPGRRSDRRVVRGSIVVAPAARTSDRAT